MTITLPDLLVLAAAGTYFLAYLIINQVILRVLVLIGTVCYIAYYATVADDPLWVAIWTSVALGLSNIFGLCLLLGARSRLAIPQEYRALYENTPGFKEVPPGDFGAIIKAASEETYEDAQQLMSEDAPNETLYYLLSGSAQANKLGHSFDLPPGIFLGEAAYLLNTNAAATISTEPGATVLRWDFRELRRLSQRRPRFKLALEALISRDQARKVAMAVAPDSRR